MPDDPAPAVKPDPSANPAQEPEDHAARTLIEAAIAPLLRRIEALEREMAELRKASSKSQHR